MWAKPNPSTKGLSETPLATERATRTWSSMQTVTIYVSDTSVLLVSLMPRLHSTICSDQAVPLPRQPPESRRASLLCCSAPLQTGPSQPPGALTRQRRPSIARPRIYKQIRLILLPQISHPGRLFSKLSSFGL